MTSKHWSALAITAGLVCSSAAAQERARVLSSVPVVQQVGVPQQFCEDVQVYSGQRSNGTGAILGAVIGGVAGNALARNQGHPGPQYGHGRPGHGPHWNNYNQGPSRGTATVVGALAGGVIGNVIETSNSQPSYDTARKCTNETVYENRTVGYDVTYEYAGQRYTTRMDHNPGAWVPIHVQPQGQYSSSSYGSRSGFVGPSGVYQSAPPGVVVTESITYTPPSPPMVIGVDVGGYPPPPPQWHRPPPPNY